MFYIFFRTFAFCCAVKTVCNTQQKAILANMNITKRFLTLIAAMALVFMASAQVLNPTKWSYTVKELSEDEVELRFTAKIDAGWHLYSQKSDPNGPIPMEVTFDESKDYKRIGGVVEPKYHEEMDDVFKVMVRSFSGTVTFRQKIKRMTDKPFKVTGSLYYQLCNDGSCIAPDDVPFAFNVKEATKADTTVAVVETVPEDSAAAAEEEPTVKAEISDVQSVTEEPEAESKKSGSLWGLFFGALLAGIVTMVTPCVFPMIPMTVNFFMHSSGSKRKNRRQVWVFGLSIVFIFTVLGAILSLFFGPEVLNLIGTHGIPNLIFFAIFITFALSFFGLFEIKMPEKWVNKSDEQADKGGWAAPFFIALTTVLISFSCTGPIIGAALIEFTTSSTNRRVSLVTMLGFGLGFALPFTLLAMFPSMLKNMKSGSWLNSVKIVFAFLELAFGLKFLQMADLYWGWGLLNRDVYLALWIVIFSLMGVYLLGKIKFKGDSDVEHIGVVRLFLTIITFTFVVYMIPGLWGAPLNAISGFLPPMDTQDFNIERIVVENQHSSVGGQQSVVYSSTLPADRKYADKLHMPTGFEGFYDLDEAKAYAKTVGKPIFIDFTGRNCANCREMEQSAWSKPEAKKLLNERFVMCALYADMNDIDLPEDEWVTDERGRVIKTLGRRNLNYQIKTFNQNAQPCYVVIDSDGKVLSDGVFVYDPKASAATKAEGFVKFLEKALE